MTRAVLVVLFIPLLAAGLARGDDAIPRYVAQQGEDRGDCALPVRPCRTIQYALSAAGKGDQVRVAAGTYQVTDVLDALRIVASAVDVRGGFERFDHFLRQAPKTNATTLTGVPLAFRDRLQARGFRVVADGKGLDAAGRAALGGFLATQTSSDGVDCEGDAAGDFACDNVDLLAHVALADLSSSPAAAADVWGFVDLNTEREYALLGVWNGLAVVDVTDPAVPVEVGTVPGALSDWRDVKVTQRYDPIAHRWRTYAYVSTEQAGRLVVADLTGLPNRVRLGRRSDTSAHNVYVSNVDYATGVALDEDTTPPLLQVLGSGNNRGAFRAFDVGDPLNLVEVATSERGYSHDATSMRVSDDRASACKDAATCEVLFDFNESHLEIWDFSDRRAPELLSSTTYANAGYVHSGWWTEDGRHLFVHDEFDETEAGIDTTVRVFDLADLTNPSLAAVWTGPTAAIDHNGYVRGNRYYMSNYTRGLTILDITDPVAPAEVGFFDTYPVTDEAAFSGAWGVYPFLPSGNVLVSDFNGGLFVLADRTRHSDGVRLGFARRAFAGEEGDDVSVSVVRTGDSGGAVTVDYAVLVGSADGADIVASTGTLDWPETREGGDSIRSVSVPLVRDDLAEPIERAFVRLANPTGGAVLGDVNMAYVFVGDAGETAAVGFSETRLAVEENAKRLIATVKRMGSPIGAVSVDYEVSAISASPGSDYLEVEPGRLTWADGDATARTIVVPLVEDDADELAEQFEIRLSSPVGANLVDDRLLVDINADGMAATGFMLFEDRTGTDLQPVTQGKRIATDAVPEHARVRVEVRPSETRSGADRALGSTTRRKQESRVASVVLTVEGSDETHTDDEPPFLFDILGRSPQGKYTLRATPYSGDGGAGHPLSVTFSVGSVGDAPPVLSSDATLREFDLTGIDLDFDSGTETYVVTVAPQLARTTVSLTTATGATFRISPSDADSERPDHQVDLAIGLNTIDVAVTAEDGETTKNYTVRAVRAPFVAGP